jgi:hypothetical protein
MTSQCYIDHSKHYLEDLQSSWDGKKFNLSHEHNKCLISAVHKFNIEQIDYIFSNFQGEILNNLGLIMSYEYFDIMGMFVGDDWRNKFYEKTSQLIGLKEHLENNLIKVIKYAVSCCGGGGWIIKTLCQVKIRVTSEVIDNIFDSSIIISLLDNNPLYKFKEKVEIMQRKIWYNRSESEFNTNHRKQQFEDGLLLITVRELQHRYQEHKSIEVKKFMVSKLKIVKDLSMLILLYI